MRMGCLFFASIKPSPSDDILFGSLRKTRSATTIEAHCLWNLILEGNRYLVVEDGSLFGRSLDLFRRVQVSILMD